MSTSQTNGLWTMTDEFKESIAALEKAVIVAGGDPPNLFDLFRTDKDYAQRIARAMVKESQKTAGSKTPSEQTWEALGVPVGGSWGP